MLIALRLLLLTAGVFWGSPLAVVSAQDSRAETLRAAREKKQQALQAPRSSTLERVLKKVETGGVPLITRGRIEADAFEPELWKPEYPNPAFGNMRLDDAFWAARIVSTFDAPSIRAIVEKARYSDPRATAYLTETLLKRREKVLRTWLTAVNPAVDFALSDTGDLTFANATERAGVATPPQAYIVQWSKFDNAAGTATAVGQAIETPATKAAAPASLIAGARRGDFIEVAVAARHAEHPAWATPVTVHFRRASDRWELVGLKKLPQ